MKRTKKRIQLKKKDRLGYCDGIPQPNGLHQYNMLPQYNGLPQYYGGTPLTEEQLASQKLNNGIQAGAQGLSAIGDIVGNNNVDNSIENTYGDTFDGLMRNSSELNASANKEIDSGNVAGSALKGAGQGLSMGMATGNPYIAAGAAVVGGVTGLFTGNKAEKDRIDSLKRQADERVSQAEDIKLNNLNSNIPIYQMANGGDIPPIKPMIPRTGTIPNSYTPPTIVGRDRPEYDLMEPRQGTIPNPYPLPTIDTMRILGSKPNWANQSITNIRGSAMNDLGISGKEFDKNYKKDPKGYMQELSEKLNFPRDIPNYRKSSKYTKYKTSVTKSSGEPTLLKNMNHDRKLRTVYPSQLQWYNVPYSKATYDSTLDPEYIDAMYRYVDYQSNKKAYGGNINMDNNNAITKYNGQTHEGQDGGIPIDSNGNPTILTGNKPVALTEDGEVNYKGYIFSNRLKYQ